MFKNTLVSFALAIQNIRANLFHTALSVLGIVIGVAALVSILSFIDGLEKFAKEQITETTGLSTLILSTESHHQVNGVRLKKDSFAFLDMTTFQQLLEGIEGVSRSAMNSNRPAELRLDTSAKTLGAILQGATAELIADSLLLAGRGLSKKDLSLADSVVLVNQVLAKQALGDERWANLPGKTLHWKNRRLKIIGVYRTENKEAQPKAMFPISLLSADELREAPPTAYVEVADPEKINAVKKALETKLGSLFANRKDDIKVISNDFRVGQAEKGFLLFRIIMGLIVGISILVGGIGVMNVLLISVNERTVEIGIRKAVGASQGDIRRQFLAESITVSLFGSFLGLVFGVLATMAIIPIVKMLTELPFDAVYTWNTFLTISVIAVLVGVIFGTYPAMKAAKLDPVEAIRRE